MRSKYVIAQVALLTFIIFSAMSVAATNKEDIDNKNLNLTDENTSQLEIPENECSVVLNDPTDSNNIICPKPGDEIDKDIQIHSEYTSTKQAPIASFTYTPLKPYINQIVRFDATSSSDDGRIIKYIWSYTTVGVSHFPIVMDDITPASTFSSAMDQAILEYSWENPGMYEVTLVIIDDDGLKDKDCKIVEIIKKEEQEEDIPIDSDGDLIPDCEDIDDDNDGWSDEEEIKYGTDPLNPCEFPQDTDNDHIPDIEDPDDDNDGWTDQEEETYGTDPKDPNDYPLDPFFESLFDSEEDINNEFDEEDNELNIEEENEELDIFESWFLNEDDFGSEPNEQKSPPQQESQKNELITYNRKTLPNENNFDNIIMAVMCCILVVLIFYLCYISLSQRKKQNTQQL